MGAEQLLRKRSEIRPDMMDCPVYAIQDIYIGGDCAPLMANGEMVYYTCEGIWFTRDEAQKFLDATRYNFSKHARVYAHGARGQLKTLLKALTVDDTSDKAKPTDEAAAGEKVVNTVIHAPAGELGDEQIRREIETFLEPRL